MRGVDHHTSYRRGSPHHWLAYCSIYRNKKGLWEYRPRYQEMGIASGRSKGPSKKRFNLRWELVFCNFPWLEGLKEFSSSGSQKGWKDYQGVIHNNYYGGNIENDHHVICLITEHVSNHFAFSNLTTPVSGMPRKVLDNDTTIRDKFNSMV